MLMFFGMAAVASGQIVAPIVVTEETKITASDAAVNHTFGEWVALAGPLMVVGSDDHDHAGYSSGLAYVYRSTGPSWMEVATLKASDAAIGDWFGQAVAIGGDEETGEYVVAVGAFQDDLGRGSTYIYRSLDGGDTWTQTTKLLASDRADGDLFGHRVVLDWSPTRILVVVGAPEEDDLGESSGAAYVYRSEDGGLTFTEMTKLLAFDGTDDSDFGEALAIQKNLLVVGADGHGNSEGCAYVYRTEDDGLTWPMMAKLTASDGLDGDLFAHVVSLDNNIIVVGAFGKDTVQGAAYVYRSLTDGRTWQEVAILTASDGEEYDWFGYSAAVSGNTIIVGADGENYAEGAVYLYETLDNGSTWAQVYKLKASDASYGDWFGNAVHLVGNTAIVGAPYADTGFILDTGAAYHFALTQPTSSPTAAPTTSAPPTPSPSISATPTSAPTPVPSPMPTVTSAPSITKIPSPVPTPAPSSKPTNQPTPRPSAEPTSRPTHGCVGLSETACANAPGCSTFYLPYWNQCCHVACGLICQCAPCAQQIFQYCY